MNTGVAVGVAVGVLAYVALLGLIVFFAVRWSRSILTKKSTVLGAGLEGLGAKKTGEVKLRCKATNVLGQSQPLEPLWNPAGYMRNVVETVTVNVQKA